MYCGLPMFFRPNQRGWITLKARHVDNSKPFTMIGSMILSHSPWLFSWFKVIHNDCFHDSEPFTVIVFTIHSYSKWLFSWFYAIHRDCFYESKLFTNHHDCFHDSKHEFFRKIQYPMVVPHEVMPKLLRIGIDWSTILLATERIFSLPPPPPPSGSWKSPEWQVRRTGQHSCCYSILLLQCYIRLAQLLQLVLNLHVPYYGNGTRVVFEPGQGYDISYIKP